MNYQPLVSDDIAAPVPNKSAADDPVALLSKVIGNTGSTSSMSTTSGESNSWEELDRLGFPMNHRRAKLASASSPVKIVRFNMQEIRVRTIESKESNGPAMVKGQEEQEQDDGDNKVGEAAGKGIGGLSGEEQLLLASTFQSSTGRMTSPPPPVSLAAEALQATQKEMLMDEMQAELGRKNRRLQSLKKKLQKMAIEKNSETATHTSQDKEDGLSTTTTKEKKVPRLPTLNLNLLLGKLLETLTAESKVLSHTRLYAYLSMLRESYDSWSASTSQLMEERNMLEQESRATAELLTLRTEENAALLAKLTEPPAHSPQPASDEAAQASPTASKQSEPGSDAEPEYKYQYRQLLGLFSAAQTNYEDQISELSFQLSHLASYSGQLESQLSSMKDELERLKISYQELYAQMNEDDGPCDVDMMPIVPLSDTKPIFSQAESQKLQSQVTEQTHVL